MKLLDVFSIKGKSLMRCEAWHKEIYPAKVVCPICTIQTHPFKSILKIISIKILRRRK